MYQVQHSGALANVSRRLATRRGRGLRISRNVVLLGLTSLFTDLSAEMVATILPLYLVYTLGFTPLQFGVVDGLYQGGAALVRVAGGFAADRTRRYKEVAAVGYGLSALCKLGLLFASAWTALSAIILLDRTGKGIRTAPRDALISLSSRRSELAGAFGVHRTLDTAGALLGPLAAFGLLALAPDAFDVIFVVSFCAGLVGLGILVLFVENRPALEHEEPAEEPTERVSLRAAAGLLRITRVRALVIVGSLLGVATISDGFLYLGLQRRLDFEARFFPLLFVVTALAYMLLAVPVGRLADRIGRGRVFVGGYALLLAVYAALLLPTSGSAWLLVCLVVLGAYYAATDGVLMALASAALPQHLRGSGLALLVTATSLARLLASVLFGMLWTGFGLQTAVLCFGVALALGLMLAAVVLRSSRWSAAHA
jgi:MFS family permease